MPSGTVDQRCEHVRRKGVAPTRLPHTAQVVRRVAPPNLAVGVELTTKPHKSDSNRSQTPF